jgi:hypothetical protein
LSSLARDAEPARRYRVFRTVARTSKLPRDHPAWTVEGADQSSFLDPSARCADGDRACGRRLLDACGPAGCSAPRPGRTSSLTSTTLGQTPTNSPTGAAVAAGGADRADAVEK